MVDILCVGNASYDIITYTDGYPQENSKAETHLMLESGGGPAANAAYLLAKWGARCALAAALGVDAYGARISSEFAEVGADLSLAQFSDEWSTPVSVVIVNTRNGSRTIVNRKSHGAVLALDPARLTGMKPRALLFDGHEPDASEQAMVAYPDALTILDAGSRREGTERLARVVDYLAASERFALQMTGLPDLDTDERRTECLRLLREINGRNVIVTLGGRGLIYDIGDGCRALPAFPATAVDTTAAGDIFHGALAYALLHSSEIEDALALASMAASLSVRTHGGRASIPTLEETRAALETAF